MTVDDPRQSVLNIDRLLNDVKAIEDMLPLPPGVPERTNQICTLAYSIAYNAPNRYIAD